MLHHTTAFTAVERQMLLCLLQYFSNDKYLTDVDLAKIEFRWNTAVRCSRNDVTCHFTRFHPNTIFVLKGTCGYLDTIATLDASMRWLIAVLPAIIHQLIHQQQISANWYNCFTFRHKKLDAAATLAANNAAKLSVQLFQCLEMCCYVDPQDLADDPIHQTAKQLYEIINTEISK